jgi:hypothetical protein
MELDVRAAEQEAAEQHAALTAQHELRLCHQTKVFTLRQRAWSRSPSPLCTQESLLREKLFKLGVIIRVRRAWKFSRHCEMSSL